jgi:hypothetical protein
VADDSTNRQTIEQCLRDGFGPFRVSIAGSRGSAVLEAARRLGIPHSTLASWVSRQEANARSGRAHALPDWSLFGLRVDSAPPIVPEMPADPIEVRRLRDQIGALTAALRDAERRTAQAEDIRSGLTLDRPIEPTFSPSTSISEHGRQAVILHISDLHAGEVISSPEILGANSYDLATFRARMDRLFSLAAKLCKDHWPRDDPAPQEIIICLGGDLVSGSIHPELAETNDGTDYQIFREVAGRIVGGVRHLRDSTGLPIRVYSVPGNHGRQVLKPQHKRQGLQSWDILVADFAESSLRDDAGIQWFRAEGTDCYFDVFGWPILLTHGHAMGTGGGQGFIGPLAPIARGHQKVIATELRQHRPVYMVLSAHYHTTVKTPWGFGNGSLVGYNEFVRHHRGEPEPAQQNMLVLHERKGLIRWQPIYVGDPSEGTLYRGGWRTAFDGGGGHEEAETEEPPHLQAEADEEWWEQVVPLR